ncbi:hypothetical protein Z043_116982 [Scleropages formosus]|uniref:Electron transfer flavoprotein beta subunit lysine methyltransferase n=1 Tax=Scleropages formosus TaxID=113540 RepID=A0A0P7YE95_SCLFO|nr:hypothetical protein Z043_116982 [Scleropages formosus]
MWRLRALRPALRGNAVSRGRNRRTDRARFGSEASVTQFILENTEVVSGNSLTPEISLRLFTPNCKFWHERAELWPFADPFWAIYWPGGQALARYLLDEPRVAKDKKVLDLGSGCGASAIAAKLSGSANVLVNDIDPIAAIACELNCELNGLDPFPSETENLIGSEPKGWDLILLGDMFYEEALADSLHIWLQTCIRAQGTQVLIGDPGRGHLEKLRIKRHLHQLAEFELPHAVRKENFGLTRSSVWHYHPEL